MFHNLGFQKRFRHMGDRAEAVFEDWANQKGIAHVRWGLRRPPFEYTQYLPTEIRWMPDRLAEDTSRYIKDTYHPDIQLHFFVECKGVGRDQIVKIKTRHIPVLLDTQDKLRRKILMFINDSHLNRISISHSVEDICTLSEHMKVNRFHDGAEYFEFPTDVFEWEDYIPTSPRR